MDLVVRLTLGFVVVIGAYQCYFFCQRHPARRARVVCCRVDNWFSYAPYWVWIYAGVYYLGFLLLVVRVKDFSEFSGVAFSFMILLAIHMCFFILLPTTVPQEWREVGRSGQKQGLSDRFMRFVQSIDGSSNSFPSMHASAAVLVALHMRGSSAGGYMLIFPLLIGLSALFTKQHSVWDVLVGLGIGWIVFHIWGVLAMYR